MSIPLREPLALRIMQPVYAAMLAVLCAGLAGCAAPPPPPPPAKPAPVVDQVDGEYRGTTTRYQADSRACPHPGLVTVIVWDNKFQYRWDHETWLDGAIGDDGSVTGGGPNITLQGRADGKQLTGDVTNGACGFHFTLTKRGTK